MVRKTTFIPALYPEARTMCTCDPLPPESEVEPELRNDGPELSRRTMISRALALALSFLGGGRLHAEAPPAGRSSGAAPPWDERFELAISFQIGDPRSAAAKRPYVAVYIEDASGRPVRTIVLWALRQDAWIRQLRTWYRGEATRRASEGGNLIASLSSPTRPPGMYTVVWDGRDNQGRLVEQNTYIVLIETIRQNAGNHLVRQEFTFGTAPFEAELENFASISQARVHYRTRA